MFHTTTKRKQPNVKKLSLYLLLIVICTASNYSAFSQPGFYNHWQAKWITNNWPWTPDNAIDGRYIWLPIKFENDAPKLYWHDKWSF
jgi:hypothetical protein